MQTVVNSLSSVGQTISILDADPDLGAGLPDSELAAAQRRAIATIVEVDRPRWDPSPIREQAEPGWLGLFVVDGLLIRRVNVGRRAGCELFGPSDVVLLAGAYGLLRAGVTAYWFGPVAIVLTALLTIRRALTRTTGQC